MAQDIPEQDIVMGELELPPQMDPKPKMGAAAAEAAVYDTSPSLLRNPPPIPAEAAHPGAPVMAQLFAMLAGINNKMEGMENKMDGNARNMKEEIKNNTNGMREEMKKMRGEMQCMGAGLLDGLDKLKIGNGERRRATCWGRLVEVTEEVTVTETRTRHIETRETMS